MRSNLPAPSQAWGNDIERRLAALESQQLLLSNNFNTTRGQVEGLTSARSVAGVAIPWFASQTVPQPNDGRNIGERTRVAMQFLDWKDRGNLMAVTAMLTAVIPSRPDKNFDWTKFETPYAYLGVEPSDGGLTYRREFLYVLQGTMIKTKQHWVVSATFASVLDYDTYRNAYVYADLRGTPDEPEFLCTRDSSSYATLAVSATIY